MAWIDQHCHLAPGADGAHQVAAAREAGVTRMISVGCHREQSEQMAVIAGAHDGVYATAGVHPHDSSQGLEGIEELLALPQVVAVGEAGLDYHYDHSPRSIQRDVFAEPGAPDDSGVSVDRCDPCWSCGTASSPSSSPCSRGSGCSCVRSQYSLRRLRWSSSSRRVGR